MCFDPATALEAVQRWIEGALLNAENIAGDLLHALGDSPAVLSAGQQSAQDEKV